MREIEYVFYLTADMMERLRVHAEKERGEILEFVVQYESLISKKWEPIVRYDTAHGFAHKDIMMPGGNTLKQPLHFENYNLAFTYATLDLRANWLHFKDSYKQEMKNDKE